ncbi:MAG: XdhC/CoxI family protein [Acholeplasmataceae bacterium]|nr:XdhC/CoxI family protein [Acholeplasmataceae bacterium]
MMKIYETIQTYNQQGIDMVIVTAISKQGEGPVEVGKKMIVTNESTIGTVGGGALEHDAINKARELLKTRDHGSETYVLSDSGVQKKGKSLPMVCGGVVTLFFEFVGVKNHVTIFGAGHVGKALVTALHPLGFDVTVIDDRADLLDQIKDANRVVAMPFVEAIDKIGIKDGSYVVICTPSHTYDYHVINKILKDQLKPAYIGMLCSPAKLKAYLKTTYETFGKDVDLSNLYAPVGLDLGGGSPEEIAVSIVSEILTIYHGKTGHRHMREMR